MVSLVTRPNAELGKGVVSVFHKAPLCFLRMSASVDIQTVSLMFPQETPEKTQGQPEAPGAKAIDKEDFEHETI